MRNKKILVFMLLFLGIGSSLFGLASCGDSDRKESSSSNVTSENSSSSFESSSSGDETSSSSNSSESSSSGDETSSSSNSSESSSNDDETSTSSSDSSSESSSNDDTAEEGIVFKTFAVDGFNVSGRVSNATETFSFKNEISVSGDTSYEVALDEFGITTSLTKIVPLDVGNNTFYVFETVNDELVNTYTVSIYRNHLYTVSFEGLEISQSIEEGETVSAPADQPAKAGYTFEGTLKKSHYNMCLHQFRDLNLYSKIHQE